MKRFAALLALLLLSSMAHAQNAPSVPDKRDIPAANTEETRMRALEESVRALADEVAALASRVEEHLKKMGAVWK